MLEIGGLARTDQAGYGEEFNRLRDDLLANSEAVTTPAAEGETHNQEGSA